METMIDHAARVVYRPERRYPWVAECPTCGPIGGYAAELAARAMAEAHGAHRGITHDATPEPRSENCHHD